MRTSFFSICRETGRKECCTTVHLTKKTVGEMSSRNSFLWINLEWRFKCSFFLKTKSLYLTLYPVLGRCGTCLCIWIIVVCLFLGIRRNFLLRDLKEKLWIGSNLTVFISIFLELFWSFLCLRLWNTTILPTSFSFTVISSVHSGELCNTLRIIRANSTLWNCIFRRLLIWTVYMRIFCTTLVLSYLEGYNRRIQLPCRLGNRHPCMA